VGEEAAMSSNNREIRPYTADTGWRAGRLRLRHGLSQNEVARRTGKHTSFISRIERPGARRGVPKRETIEAILDAIGVTPEERAAVFQIEAPPQSPDEIAREVEAVKSRFEDTDTMVVLLDDRWVRWYVSKPYRRVLGLTDEEYEATNGEHILMGLINPASPMYLRYPDNAERLRAFSLRAAIFKLRFAEHQFDSWYLELESRMSRYPYAEAIWHTLPVIPAYADYQDIIQMHPDGTLLHIHYQVRQMYAAPRFTLMEVTPSDKETASAMKRLLGH
jgi:transcriptional regulator with XRE-family HTH domain